MLPNITKSRPAISSTKELVHRLLLIGNQASQTKATKIRTLPIISIQVVRTDKSRRQLSKWPASKPIRQVPMAGRVLTTPSGSHVFVWA